VQEGTELLAPLNKKMRWNPYLLAWLFLLLILLQSYLGWGTPLVIEGSPLTILVRSAFLLLSWHFIMAPLLKKVLFRWLNKKQQQLHSEVAAVLSLLPSTSSIIRRSWLSASAEGRRNRISRFCRTVIVNTLKHG
jgi:hypothetical protein